MKFFWYAMGHFLIVGLVIAYSPNDNTVKPVSVTYSFTMGCLNYYKFWKTLER